MFGVVLRCPGRPAWLRKQIATALSASKSAKYRSCYRCTVFDPCPFVSLTLFSLLHAYTLSLAISALGRDSNCSNRQLPRSEEKVRTASRVDPGPRFLNSIDFTAAPLVFIVCAVIVALVAEPDFAGLARLVRRELAPHRRGECGLAPELAPHSVASAAFSIFSTSSSCPCGTTSSRTSETFFPTSLTSTKNSTCRTAARPPALFPRHVARRINDRRRRQGHAAGSAAEPEAHLPVSSQWRPFRCGRDLRKVVGEAVRLPRHRPLTGTSSGTRRVCVTGSVRSSFG